MITNQISLLTKACHIETAIKRLKEFEPKDGYYLGFSGGKDSQTIRLLMNMAEVKYDSHYNVTSCDPPEVIYFMRENYPEVQFDYPGITMWNLIPQKTIPPTRLYRYCCQELKECGGKGRFVVTGVRWSESSRRKNTRNAFEIFTKSKKNKKMTYDNDDARRMFENCQLKGKFILNPIIDWKEYQVWEFLKRYSVKHCKLYDEGFSRLGCIGCPMGSIRHRKHEFIRYPKFREMYICAFEKMIAMRKNRGLKTDWTCGEDVMRWWLSSKCNSDVLDGQIAIEFI